MSPRQPGLPFGALPRPSFGAYLNRRGVASSNIVLAGDVGRAERRMAHLLDAAAIQDSSLSGSAHPLHSRIDTVIARFAGSGVTRPMTTKFASNKDVCPKDDGTC
jgi:hypothetical protein